MHSSTSSSQRVLSLSDGQLHELEIPVANAIVEGWDFRWGEADMPMTPAYWAAQAWMWSLDAPEHFRLGENLEEELLACLLGGHGIPAEVGLAAYKRLRDRLHVAPHAMANPDFVTEALSSPLPVGGRMVRYRFAKQKAAYVAAAFQVLPTLDRALEDVPLRDALTRIRGIGPKTASWVVRNLRRSDQVAILDVHILRAGRSLGIFPPAQTVERHYLALEASYLKFARSIGVAASILDSVMWITMRHAAIGRAKPLTPHATTQLSLAP